MHWIQKPNTKKVSGGRLVIGLIRKNQVSKKIRASESLLEGQPMKKTSIRLGVGAVSVAFLLAACGGSGSSSSGSKGGTLTLLTEAEQILHLDPQRNYTGEDLAFASGYLNRTLTQYTLSKDNTEASKLVADAATDTGTSADGGKTWSFTLRDGMKWQDGQPVTCADFAYGVSRTFATDIITDGPTYAISLLDIPKNTDGTSVYPGPYKAAATAQAAFDKAVSCEGNKITFRLVNAASDFNYTTTLSSFAAVRKDMDKGETYDDAVQSDGPYKIESYVKKDKLVLVRNDQWDPATDTLRAALPDRIEFVFSQPASVITERLMADAGNDAQALSPDGIDPTKLAVVFSDGKYESRRFNEFDAYVRYYAINTQKVPNVKHRQAILACLDRDALRKIAGGEYAGDYADGVVKPNIGQDYAPTGLWDTLLGAAIPATGNVELGTKLIADSGEAFPNPLVFDYGKSETGDKAAASVQESLARCGITVQPNGIEPGSYYGVVLDPAKQGSMSAAGWGPDWLNASTVIPELFTPAGGFNLSRYDNADFNTRVAAAKVISDRAAQATAWQALNTEASRLALSVPTRFGLEQRLVGSKVNGAYIWGPYGSWPYASLSVSK
ncbi:MAG: ABC transporter substrate-binding protein [Actinomycetes bacterium]